MIKALIYRCWSLQVTSCSNTTFVLRTAISVYWCYTNYFIRIVSGRVFDENNTLCSSFETFLFFTNYLEQSTPPPNSSLNPSCGSSLKQNVSRVAADLAVNDRLLHLPLTGNRCVGLYVGERTNAPLDSNLPLDICPLGQTSASLGICTVFGKIRLSGGTYVRGICSRFLYTAYVATELLLISISVTACSNYRFVWARDLLGSCGSHGIPMGIGTEMLMGMGMRTGMNVTEIGLVGFSQLHSYFLHFMSPTHRQLLTVFLFLHSNLEQRHQCGMWLRRLVYIFITVRKLSEIYLKTNLSLFFWTRCREVEGVISKFFLSSCSCFCKWLF